MALVTASIAKELYRIEIKSSSGNMVIADEPLDKGGQNKGLSPKELLAASLASCTCATLRMYADRKGWDLQKINVTIELTEEVGRTSFNRKLQFAGTLDDEQRIRLMAIANACPVHKILTHTIVIETTLI